MAKRTAPNTTVIYDTESSNPKYEMDLEGRLTLTDVCGDVLT